MWRVIQSRLALVAVACALVAAGGGYAAGRSGGADIGRAKATGERLGRERAALDRGGYTAAFAQGRKAGYGQGYRQAYGTALQKAAGK
jgi:hypothetical protein